MGKAGKFHAIASLSRGILFRDGILLVPMAALIAASIRLIRGISCGHDFEFHLISWLEVQRDWSQGVLYPHWAQTPNWGAGEARFVFYPPLTWFVGALLGYLMSWPWVPAAITVLSLASAGLATRSLARQFLPGTAATLAGILATSTPYALFTANERTAFGELAAATWIPLVLLFAWRQPRTEWVEPPAGSGKACQLRLALDGSTAVLSMILAATWLTNDPVGVMASYLLAFAALAAALLERQWWPILRAAVAVPIALGVAAFYLVPAAWEQRWIAIQQAVDVGMRVSDSWLFARHLSPDLELHDQVLGLASAIFVLTTILAIAGLAIAYGRRKLRVTGRTFWLPLAMLIPILFVLQLPISAPVWNLLPKLPFLQFPWRWLTVLGVPYSVFLAAATPLASRRSRIWSTVGWVFVLLLFAGSASILFFQYCDPEDEVDNQIAIFHAGTGVEGTDEYAAASSDNSLIASSLPDGCLVSDPLQELGEGESGAAPVWYAEQGSCDDTYTAQIWQNEHKLLQIDSDHNGFVILRLSRYPAWRITVNNKLVATIVNREDGLIGVPVAAGPSTIEVTWTVTPDVLWGRWISAASLLLLAALGWFERRLKEVRL